MILDLAHQIKNPDGSPALDETNKPVATKDVLAKALLSEPPNTTVASKMARFELWLKVKMADVKLEISTEEATLLKEASSVYPVVVYGQLVHWIEGKETWLKAAL